MDKGNRTKQSGRASMVSVFLTAMLITANHGYALGAGALILGAFLLIVPWLLYVWHERTGGTLALAGYLAMSAWIVVGFGAIKGLWGITLPIFVGTLLSWESPAYAKPVFGAFWFEITGVAMFIASVFVLYYGVEML